MKNSNEPRWSVSRRLTVAFALVALATLTVLGLVYSQLTSTESALREIVDERLPRVIQATRHVTWTTGTTVRIIAVNLSNEPGLVQMFGPQIDDRLKKVVETHRQIAAWATTDEEKALLARNAQLNIEIDAVVKQVRAARERNENAEAAGIITKSFVPLTDEADRNYVQLAEVQLRLLQEARTHANAVGRQRGWVALAAMAVLAGLTAWLGHIALGLRRVLGAEPLQVKAAVDAVRAGDLTADIPVRPGDSDSIIASTEAMRESLVNLVSRVNRSADGVAQASTVLVEDGKQFSDRTSRQAAALQETAASMEQLSATVRQNADSAQQANEHAVGASGLARQGGTVVDQVVETMKGIQEGSKQMADIIAVIDGIAFQTNILALNAAVEAARAGEHGRGFAVVASEVRTLAQRSAASAKSIRGLIAGSVEKVETGSALVDRAGTTMREVVASIQRVANIIAEISAASQEQTHGIEQVSVAVTDIDRNTQQNAAMVHASAESASNLSRQAGELLASVAAFKVLR